MDTGEEVSVGVVNTFIELSRELRQLKGLPLEIATVKGASSIFCHTEVLDNIPFLSLLMIIIIIFNDRSIPLSRGTASVHPKSVLFLRRLFKSSASTLLVT